jgi:hypothetical protein
VLHLIPEVHDKLPQARKYIGNLHLANVLMMALSRFIIEAQHATPVDDKRQPILEAVRTAAGRNRQLPNHQFREAGLAENPPFLKQ